ncbi:MAG: MFS transporter [Candidatus Heimdallarchaeaceae archaeon]
MPLTIKKQHLFYSACRIGTTTLLNIITLATFWIYTNYYGLQPILSGIGNAVGKLTIALSAFLFGYISDKLSNSKIGRRKVFMAIGSPLLAFSFVMLFVPHLFIPKVSTIMVFSWLVIWNSTFHLFYGFVITPYQSWLPEITKKGERVRVSAYQNIANTMGFIFGAGFSFFIAGYLQKSGGIEGVAGYVLALSVIGWSVLEVLFFLPTLIFIHEEKTIIARRKFKEELKIIFNNVNYIKWLIGRGTYTIGLMISMTLILDFAQHILGFNSPTEFLLTVVFFSVSMLLGFFVWTKIAEVSGKKIALITGNAWLIFWAPWTIVIGKISFIPSNFQGFLYCAIFAFGAAPLFLFPYAIIADIAHKDKQETKNNRSGLYTGFQAIPLNFFQAIGLVIAGFLRNIKDNLGLIWLGPIVALFLLLSMPILSKTNLDPLKSK